MVLLLGTTGPAPSGASHASGNVPPVSCSQSIVRRQWIDNLRDFGDGSHRDPAHFSVGTDRVLAIRQIDAERAVPGDIAVLPLDGVAQPLDRLVRRARRAAQFDKRHPADPRNVALDQISLELAQIRQLLHRPLNAISVSQRAAKDNRNFVAFAKAFA